MKDLIFNTLIVVSIVLSVTYLANRPRHVVIKTDLVASKPYQRFVWREHGIIWDTVLDEKTFKEANRMESLLPAGSIIEIRDKNSKLIRLSRLDPGGWNTKFLYGSADLTNRLDTTHPTTERE